MRIIQAPGIELHEIDRSGYDQDQDNSIVGTTAFIMGFADKGDDYATKYVNSINTFVQYFGYPTNEAETYFYNAAYEILNRGGNLYATKLPYDNNSHKKYSYCTYKVGSTECDVSKYPELSSIDGTITSYVEISSTGETDSGMMSMQDFDDLKTSKSKIGSNEIKIVNIKRQKYSNDSAFNSRNMQYVGILPVITTAANALYAQKLISSDLATEIRYNAVSCIQNINTSYDGQRITGLNNNTAKDKKSAGFTDDIGPEQNTTAQSTLSKTAASYFNSITFKNGVLDTENLKKIGVVVFQMFIDDSCDGKIGFTPVEAFCGSLNKNAVDSMSKSSTFIDRIVNQNSQYINLFSNVKFAGANETEGPIDRCGTFVVRPQDAVSLGFYEQDCEKYISIATSITNAIQTVFDANRDSNTARIDIVVDGGISNIAQFIRSLYDGGKGMFDISDDTDGKFKLQSIEDSSEWRNVILLYDNFCKNVRKDCMFIADGMRPLVLEGYEKLIRSTKPENTVENTIISRMKYISGIINSSYGAGYCDWFMCSDRYTGQYFWCPPSIKAAGTYVYTDAYSYYWMAPAGLRRGRMPEDVIDVSFNPTNEEAGKIYNSNWNYAISYPLNGIVIEGQKTFQKNKTAFDRVNVRRLFLGLEKNVRYLAKFFTYEGITDYLMQRFVDTITPVFENAKENEGIREYVIICDSRNNNSNTIDNNELHCTIAVKPVKSLEFIVLNFIATSQGASVTEIASENL